MSLPAAAQAGTAVPMVFVISNLGPGTAYGPWQNAVLLSPNADGSGAQLLGAVSFSPGAGGLAPGATLTVTQQVIVPSVGTGPRWFGITLDSGNAVFELSETNNTAFAGAPLNIVATDLRVARVTAPANANFGQTVAVEFVVTNAGSAAAAVPWVDRLYFSATSNTLATLLATADALTVPLPPGVWLNPQADHRTGDWLARFQSAASEGSDGGRRITAAERLDLLSADLPAGWVYLRVPDPADGQYRLVGVRRSDNVVIGVDTNVWVTDRTFLGQGKRPKRENILHLLDYNSPGQYTLTYALLPAVDNEPPNSTVEPLPAESRSAFLVRWSGQDNPGGSGVATYDIYYSENGGPFQRWLAATPATGSVFQGVIGRTYAFYSVAVDQSGNRESPPPAPQAQTAVVLENRPPVFSPQTNVMIWEGQTFSLVAAATDPDGDTVTYQLGAGAPPGLVLNGVSGQMTWITAEPHGPSTNHVLLLARDSGTPSLTATQSFAIIVLESNTPPMLAPIANYTVEEGMLLSITNIASDADLPAQRLTFSLGEDAPVGAEINLTNGLFTWRPAEFQGGTNYTLTVRVTDDASPALSATQTFVVTVVDTLPDFRLLLGSVAVRTNESGRVALILDSNAELLRVLLEFQLGGDRLTNLHLTNIAAEIRAHSLVSLSSNRFRARFEPRFGTVLQGEFPLADLAFGVLPGEHSAVVVLRGESLTGLQADERTATGQAGLGRVFVVGREPILDLGQTNDQIALTLYALPGRTYAIERATSLGANRPWFFERAVAPSDGLQTPLPERRAGGPSEFFRARIVPDDPLRLGIRLEGGQVVLEWSLDCAGCVLLQSPSVGPNAVWTPAGTQPQIVNGRYRVTLPVSAQQRFLRLVPHP